MDPTPTHDTPASPASQAVPHRSLRPVGSHVRTGLTVMALVALAAALVLAFTSVLDVIDIWFEYQYAAIARAVLSVAIAAAALAALGILVRGKANA